MKKSESIINISKALMNFQSSCPPIQKDKQGCNYKYADLPAILSVINPILKKNGLCFTQLTEGDSVTATVTTLLIHSESGEFFECSISSAVKPNVGKMSEIQAIGSIITYLRRYSLSSVLGIVSDEDIDGYVQRMSINELTEKIKMAQNVDELKKIWAENEDFQKDSTFSKTVKKQRELLEKEALK